MRSTNIILLASLLGCGGSLSHPTQAPSSTGGGEASDSYVGASYTEEARAMPMAEAEAAPAGPARSMGGADMAADEGGAMAPPAPPSVASAGERAAAPAEAPAGASVTVTVDTPTIDYEVEPEPVQIQQQRARLLTAASVGDHDRRGNYREYLSRHLLEQRQLGLDMTRRMRIRVVDAQGQAVNDAAVVVEMQQGTRAQGRTHADGRWDFFPSVHGAMGNASVTVTAGGRSLRHQVFVNGSGDSQEIEFRMPIHTQRARALDLAFLIDVTGSMEDELRYVNREVTDIVARIRNESPEVSVRVGAVFYRDRTDAQPLQRIQLTGDVNGFATAMNTVRASGGGDYPEDLNAGLQTAINGLSWRGGNAVRVLCVIADAPPKQYQTNFNYHSAMLESAARGIRILPVAASGADRQVEYLFRAMGTFTSSPYVYLTDDSGIGNSHMEADTDRVAVEYFNDLLTRVVNSDLHGLGMHEPAGFDE